MKLPVLVGSLVLMTSSARKPPKTNVLLPTTMPSPEPLSAMAVPAWPVLSTPDSTAGVSALLMSTVTWPPVPPLPAPT